MKPFVQKLPLTEEISFVARTYRTPDFEVSWHQHIEYELIFFMEGAGMAFIGNYIGEFKTGDVFFLGANLPHTFQKRHKKLVTGAVVVQFREDFWGEGFMDLPENRDIRKLFETSIQGLQITGQSKLLMGRLIHDLEGASGMDRIVKLCQCLQIMAQTREFVPLSTQEVKQYNHRDKERIEKVFQYTIESFAKPTTLEEIARIAHMSVPAFCNYFKKSTKKTYINFLNEVRIGHACKLLADTKRTVLDICYESGFNTLANFNKQFFRIKKMTPSSFRKLMC
ncbi:AraC family transcriptional regulator [Compostibacter hankyongensis]|uniref:AraC family transcriptional regulator n=1 Tax=Compostibacter hankyongensis TaxID=1007089 RepID=A0ABP8FLE3_9BACT